jgi:uncharacterized protein YgbK (DUF1537 family)
LTSRQIDAALRLGGLAETEVRVSALLSGDARQHIADVVAELRATLQHTDALLYTSRTVTRGSDAATSLDIARRVSNTLVEVVRGVRAARPSWVVAKGGITSHDVAVHGLGIQRAQVIGQMLPGLVSVLRPEVAAPEAVGVPYVVFAGNVGDDNALAHVITVLRAAAH